MLVKIAGQIRHQNLVWLTDTYRDSDIFRGPRFKDTCWLLAGRRKPVVNADGKSCIDFGFSSQQDVKSGGLENCSSTR